MKLVIANKCYSSWSMRPWLVLHHLGIQFEEVVIPLRREETRGEIAKYSPSGKVPVLIDRGVTVWDSVAIISYLADIFPDKPVWPSGRAERAHAKSVSLEMHSGFQALRKACPMNFGKRFARKDLGPEVGADVARICAVWGEARQRFGGEGQFLFGEFCAADAMYAPVVSRFDTYGIDVDDIALEYMAAVRAHPSYLAWRADGLAEPWSVAEYEAGFDIAEDYREGRQA